MAAIIVPYPTLRYTSAESIGKKHHGNVTPANARCANCRGELVDGQASEDEGISNLASSSTSHTSYVSGIFPNAATMIFSSKSVRQGSAIQTSKYCKASSPPIYH
jgi:hypothetical protein